MNQKTLITLAAVAVVTVGAALLIDRSRAPRSDTGPAAGTLVPGLSEHVNDTGKITFTAANSQPVVTLERSDKGWKVAQRAGYPADVGKLREFLLKLADASLVEQKTANKDRYADLGVDDVSSATAKGILVDIEGLTKPVRFIIGTFNGQGGGTFVRRVDEAQSWLAKGTLTPEKNPAEWLAKDLPSVAGDRIASVTLTRPDGKNVRAFKKAPADARFEVADIPKGRELSSEVVASGLGAVLSELRIDDVAAASEVTAPAQAIKARYVAFDGLMVDATAWKVGEKGYVMLHASLDSVAAEKHVVDAQAREAGEHAARSAAAVNAPDAVKAADDSMPKPQTVKAEAPAAPLAVTDPVKDRVQRLAALNDEVARLNAAFDGWSFVLPTYKYSNIDKSIDELLKPLEEKTATKPTARIGK